MKNVVLFLSLMLVSLNGYSSVKISYQYDNAGNRISRQYSIEPDQLFMPQLPDTIIVDDQSSGSPKIIVYPNPTKGPLELEVTNFNSDEKVYTRLYSPQGAMLKNSTTTTGKTSIDMSSYASGWYLLRVLVGKKTVEFKIIKE